MPTELIDRPVLVLPEGTDAADSRRLAQALDAHGVAGVLRQLDAVAQLMRVLSEPEPISAPVEHRTADTSRCGHLTRTGKVCRRRMPCFWHQPDEEAVVAVAEPDLERIAELPAIAVSPEPEAEVTRPLAGRKPASCPKCGGGAAGISRERLPEGVMAWRCQPCGWHEELPLTPATAA